jgi:hypothetical protein
MGAHCSCASCRKGTREHVQGQGSISFGHFLQAAFGCDAIGCRVKLVEPCSLELELDALAVLIGLGLFKRKATGG